MLELQGLTRRYGDLVALDDLSFTVAEGQLFGFVGPNGAGKTTAMRIILGVLAPDVGEVRWRGQPMMDKIRKRLGDLPEDRQTFSIQCVRIPGHRGASSATSASRSSTAAELRNQLICGAGPGLHQPLGQFLCDLLASRRTG
jgi:ABC-type cobalamin/Fe3+-siderophores transport system ATPase subunit